MTPRTPCARVRELLLEAEPDELHGIGGSPVAEHVRGCAECAAAAGRILQQTEALAAHLDEASVPPVAEILRRAGVPSGQRLAPERDATAGSETAPPKRTPSGRRRWLWAPAAAAAAIAVLFVALETRGPEPGRGRTVPPSEPPPVVEPASSGTVAVMQTDDPDITVLWFF